MSEQKYIGVQGLVDAAASILSSGLVPQEKKNVVEIPDERTVRFYIAQGLIPDTEKEGRKKVFTDLHLFTLLVIKKLQSKGLPISVIRELVQNQSVSKLKKLLGEEIHVFTDEASLSKHQAETPGAEKEDVVVINDLKAREEFLKKKTQNDAETYLRSLLMSPRMPKNDDSQVQFADLDEDRRVLFSMAESPDRIPTTRAREWKRFDIAPGVELHIERGYRFPKDSNERRSIIDSIIKILRSRP